MTAIKAKRPLRSLLQAKNNFVSSIRVGIDELMTSAGYSRQRATDTLLRELGRGGEIPTDQEIFHLMEHQGLGMDEASQALIVSKAVRRAMSEEGLSAVEAIDDLVQRLSVSNLLASSSPEKMPRHDNKQPQHEEAPITSLPRVHSATMLAQRRTRSNAKPIPPKPSKPEPQKQKNQSQRKRSISEEKVSKDGRARADSVAEEVNAKLDTRPKGKRDAATVAVPPPAKRPREI